jgi:hypothetical protein
MPSETTQLPTSPETLIAQLEQLRTQFPGAGLAIEMPGEPMQFLFSGRESKTKKTHGRYSP